MLAEYNHALPGLGERIVANWERQQENLLKQTSHRMDLEKRVVGSGIISERLGIACAFILCGGSIAGGVWLASIGQGAWGVSIIGAALAALAAVFYKGSSDRSKERQNRLKMLTGQDTKSAKK